MQKLKNYFYKSLDENNFLTGLFSLCRCASRVQNVNFAAGSNLVQVCYAFGFSRVCLPFNVEAKSLTSKLGVFDYVISVDANSCNRYCERFLGVVLLIGHMHDFLA